jgi:hypothetical protein
MDFRKVTPDTIHYFLAMLLHVIELLNLRQHVKAINLGEWLSVVCGKESILH